MRPAETRLNDIYLIVHAVSGLPAGTYVYHAQEKTLELLQEGNFRHQAEMLALGQDRVGGKIHAPCQHTRFELNGTIPMITAVRKYKR